MPELKLSDLDPAQVKVVETPQAAPQAAPLKLSDLKPGSFSVIETTPVPSDDSLGEKAAKGIYKGIIAVGRGWDSVTGAPTRAMLSEWQKGNGLGAGVEAFGKQFAEAPEKAPTGKDIAAAAGFSDVKVATPFRGLDPKSGRWHTSPADVAGFGVDVLADPTNVLPVSKIAKGLSWATRKTAQVAGKTAGKTAAAVLGKETAEAIRNKGVQALSSVSEDTVAKYARLTPDEIAKVPKREVIMDRLDAVSAKASSVIKETEDAVKSAERGIDQKLANYLAEIRSKTGTVDEASAWISRLGEEKSVLGSLSEQADDALGRAQGVVQRRDVLRLMERVHDSLNVGKGGAVGEAAAATQTRIRGYAERLRANPSQTMEFPELRDVMRQIRADTNWKQAAGEFNEALDGARKKISESMSEVLKGRGAGMVDDPALKEYADYMERMAPLAQSLEKLDKYFGTPERAMSSMKAISSTTEGGKAKLIRDAVENHVYLTGDSRALDMLTESAANRDMLRAAGKEDLRPKVFPEEWAELQQTINALNEGRENLSGMGRLSQNRTEVLAGKLNLSIKDRRAIKALGEAFDDGTLLDDIEKRAVVDAFGKDATRGSKMTNMGAVTGAAVGNALGGPSGIAPGAAVGGALGALGDRNAGPLFRKMLDAQKAPIIAVPKDALTTESLHSLLKGTRSRTRVDTGLKGSQIMHTQSDDHEKKRDAIKKRIKAGENP